MMSAWLQGSGLFGGSGCSPGPCPQSPARPLCARPGVWLHLTPQAGGPAHHQGAAGAWAPTQHLQPGAAPGWGPAGFEALHCWAACAPPAPRWHFPQEESGSPWTRPLGSVLVLGKHGQRRALGPGCQVAGTEQKHLAGSWGLRWDQPGRQGRELEEGVRAEKLQFINAACCSQTRAKPLALIKV